MFCSHTFVTKVYCHMKHPILVCRHLKPLVTKNYIMAHPNLNSVPKNARLTLCFKANVPCCIYLYVKVQPIKCGMKLLLSMVVLLSIAFKWFSPIAGTPVFYDCVVKWIVVEVSFRQNCWECLCSTKKTESYCILSQCRAITFASNRPGRAHAVHCVQVLLF